MSNLKHYQLGLLALMLASLSGCISQAPYQSPQVRISPHWETPTVSSATKMNDLTQWWAQFNDPVLSQMIQQAQENSPTLLKAWAKIEQARASYASSRSSLFPSLTGSGSATRAKDGQISNQRSGSLDASWEIDLFGKLRSASRAEASRVEEQQANWHDSRVSLAAEVADDYVQYRSCEMLLQTYQHELSSMQKTEQATALMVKAGFTAPSDGALARANLASTQLSLLSQQKQCDLLVKSLVEVTGIQETELRSLLDRQKTKALPVPALFDVSSIPTNMLRNRPDIAASEREVYATYAEIAEAQADRYPSLSLSGSISASITSGVSSSAWSFGPSLSIPIFDAGKKKAALNSARAAYVAAVADYQSQVKSAVSEVEQALVQLDSIAKQEQSSETSVQENQRYVQALYSSWKAGNTNLLDLESARRTALSAQLDQISLQTTRVQEWIALYKAVGGGWQQNLEINRPDKLLKDLKY